MATTQDIKASTLEIKGRKRMAKKPKGLFYNINKRKKAGTSRSKSKSTIAPKTYRDMKKWGKKKKK